MGRPKITEELLEKSTSHINKNEIIEFHKWHDFNTTRKHFNLTHSQYKYLRKKYDLKMDKETTINRRKATKFERYGDENYNNMDKNKSTKLKRYGSETYNNPERQVKTSRERWGDNYNNRTQCAETKLLRHGSSTYNNMTKNKYTKLQRYGNENYNNMEKHIESSKICNKEEDNMYIKLVNIFGSDDVIRQYYDKDRYPFHCDFYIKSKDLFIEYQGFWTHHTHPFDETNEEDLKQVKLWESKDTDFCRNAIYTWTDLDVKKRKIAEKNNLNIKFIYPKR